MLRALFPARSFAPLLRSRPVSVFGQFSAKRFYVKNNESQKKQRDNAAKERKLSVEDKTAPNVDEPITTYPEKKFDRAVWVYGCVLATLGGLLGLYKGYRYWSENTISLVYAGRGSGFDGDLDNQFQFPLSAASHYFNRSDDRLKEAKKFEGKYPTSVIPQLLLAQIYMQQGDLDASQAHLDQAHSFLEKYAKENECFSKLFPIVSVYKQDFPMAMKEVKEGRIWCVEGRVRTNRFQQGIIGQSSIVKLADNSLVIINPLTFTPEIVQEINSLGNVVALFSPATFHTAGLLDSTKHWPDAQVYTSIMKEKDLESLRSLKKPRIDLSGSANEFCNELVSIPLTSVGTNEIMVYDPSSRALIGPCEMIVRNTLFNDEKTVEDVGAAIGLGLFRGSYTQEYCPPNSNFMYVCKAHQLDKILVELYQFKVDTFILGHGGIVESTAEEFLKPNLHWIKYCGLKQDLKWHYSNAALF